MVEKTRKKISRKMVCIICGILAVIVILTSLIFAFSKKESNEVLQATKSTANAVNLENNDHMHVEEDASGDKVPVPNGYVGSSASGENEIDTGYVIYEGEEAVTDSNVADDQKSRNQYVWVPVPDISKFYGTDANGKKWGKLYSIQNPLNWEEFDGIMSINSKRTSFREPDIVASDSDSTGYDMDSELKNLGLGATTTHEFLNQLEQEFNNMIASVEKYGGFYIGRYETGNFKKEISVVRKGNTETGVQNWYDVYIKCKTLKGNNTNIETGLIWGNQWDRTLMWLIETGNKTELQMSNSVSWGNYYDSEFEYIDKYGTKTTKAKNHAKEIPTGNSEYTKANNIYDLAGNTREWTMETRGLEMRAIRGGDCYVYGRAFSVSNREEDYRPTVSGAGCHAMLYIK